MQHRQLCAQIAAKKTSRLKESCQGLAHLSAVTIKEASSDQLQESQVLSI